MFIEKAVRLSVRSLEIVSRFYVASDERRKPGAFLTRVCTHSRSAHEAK